MLLSAGVMENVTMTVVDGAGWVHRVEGDDTRSCRRSSAEISTRGLLCWRTNLRMLSVCVIDSHHWAHPQLDFHQRGHVSTAVGPKGARRVIGHVQRQIFNPATSRVNVHCAAAVIRP